ncbi:fumarylacetoacetate hydrolase family protein [Streptomyces sp. NPDC048483]|uniref:fumarylacetoacetate hydrolase family protein n=1 Tax=Streptomyces sp. NPDC048483 TaxID=3154927 RepID=UPI0034170ABA
MRLATYRHGGSLCVGVVDDGSVRPLEGADADRPLTTMLDVINRFDEVRDPPDPAAGATSHPLADVELLAPLPRPPRNILCVGKNYREHAEEFDRSGFNATATGTVPDAPMVFTKPPEAVTGHGASIRLPRKVTECLDYEAELAVVIGRAGRGISREEARRHVFGYTIVNDITARDLQARHSQWFLGKALDDSCPMGPWIVTADEIDPAALRIRCWVNDELRQEADTSALVFDVSTLIETISAGTTLLPGDVIATGTPAGVGAGFTPPRFLADGDRVRIEISGIGTLENTVVAE